jgi:hypothetical protein
MTARSEAVVSFHVEGVPYYRFKVRLRLKNGNRRSFTQYSPGYPWVRTEVARRVDAEFGIENVRAGSCTIEQVIP